MKIVVTGVRFDVHGRAFSPDDPKLRLIGDYKDPAGSMVTQVPFLPHDAFYKCIGVYRRADGHEAGAWLHLKGELEVAVRRMSKVRKGALTMVEFDRCSDALLGGSIMHYCQSVYFSFEQFDKVEVVWRRAFARSCLRGRPCSRAELYLDLEHDVGGRGGRTHGWVFGLAALFVAINKALADVDDTPQRAAARSTMALAMAKWGCVGDPRFWGMAHLGAALEWYLARNSTHQTQNLHLNY